MTVANSVADQALNVAASPTFAGVTAPSLTSPASMTLNVGAGNNLTISPNTNVFSMTFGNANTNPTRQNILWISNAVNQGLIGAGYTAAGNAAGNNVIIECLIATGGTVFRDTIGLCGTITNPVSSFTGQITSAANPVVCNATITATHTALASAAQVPVFVPATATAIVAILDIKVFFSTGLSGGGGDRLLSLTDGTSKFNNNGITAALLGTPICTVWGGTGNPLTQTNQPNTSVAGSTVYLQYAGGTTDFSSGQVTVSVTYAQIVT